MNFIVLSSSRGTVFKAVLERIADHSLHATCLGLVTDRPDRSCIEHANTHGIPVRIVERQKDEDREHYDRRVNDAIQTLTPVPNPQPILACMGWMFLFSPWFVSEYRNRILNVHPSLLPKHAGAHAHDLVLKARETESGMTIHLIDEGLDSGTILVQKKCSVLPEDTVETLKARVQELECEWYPKTLEMIHRKELNI